MKRNKFIKIFSLLFVLNLGFFSLAYAEEQSITFGEYQVEYDETFDAGSGQILYYQDGTLVLSTSDTNNDGNIDLWLRYADDEVLDLEAHDLDFDGAPDAYALLDEDERVTELSGFSEPEKDLVIQDAEQKDEKSFLEVQVPDYSNTESSSKGLIWAVVIIVIAGAGFVFFKKRNKK